MKRHVRKEPRQLGKTSVVKLIIFLVVIILLEAATGLFTYNQFASRTYKQEYAAYQSQADLLAKHEADVIGEFGNLEHNSAQLEKVVKTAEESGRFETYVIFTESDGGRIIYSGGVLTNGANIRDAYSLKYNTVGLVQAEGKTYVFAPSKLGNSQYRLAGLADFSERRQVINNLLGNVTAIIIVSGLLIALAFIVYAYLIAGRERTSNFKYRLTVNKDGKIVRSNHAFKHEFSAVSQIKSFGNLDNKNFNLITLNANYGEKLVAMRLNSLGTKTKMLGGDVANSRSFIQTDGECAPDADGRTTSALSNIFESFVEKGKRTLLGIIFISNLEQIKTLFGKQMALDIQRIILKKTREKFTYAYELDFAYIGVAYPDGKKLDNLIADLDDVNRYISAPIKMEDNLFTLELKSGFAMCDSSMTDLSFAAAYKAAEAACQRVIDTGIADYIIYHESQRKLYSKYFITFDIKQMLAEGAFEMEYQPQYNIKEERIEGFEALFRVKKSWNVNVDTFSFITYAERTGAMVQLGDFIFDTGMQFAKKLEGKNVSVSLNVSPVQLMQAGFTENFLRLYKKYNLKPGSICVEITESFLMTNFNETLKKLGILTAQGIDVHLDDFGTEYSSLLYIKKLPISTIKIDKEFVKDVLVSKESQAIIKFITNIAKLLNRTTICEGVETVQEFDMLNYLGCDTIQGWLIGKSMKADAALQIVDNFDYKQIAAQAQK